MTTPKHIINAKGRDLIVGVEGGGTSFLVSIAASNNSTAKKKSQHFTDQAQEFGFEILLEQEFATQDDPKETLKEIAEFLLNHRLPSSSYSALGVVCFGPLGVDKAKSESYGCILPGSPKANWRNVNVLKPLLDACSDDSKNPIPHVVETDVNAPAFAEYLAERRSGNPNISSMAYVTVGTGVGVGLVINHQTVHGMLHPEGGHVYARPLEDDLTEEDDKYVKEAFPGYSWGDKAPYKGRNTIEGLSCSVSLCERLEHIQKHEANTSSSKDAAPSSNVGGSRDVLRTLPDDHVVWDHCARGLANLCVSLILMNSIEKISLGGGIMRRGESLLEKIRRGTVQLLNGYIDTPQLQNGMKDYIVATRFGNHAGIIGALMLARQEMQQASTNPSEQMEKKGAERKCTGCPFAFLKKSNHNDLAISFWHGVAVGFGVTACLALSTIKCKGSQSRV